MISDGLQKILNSVYAVLKYNVIFWVYTFVGGIILGIGPAVRIISEMYRNVGLDYEQIKILGHFDEFKKYFKEENISFYLVVAAFALIFYNLYLSSQIKGLLWFAIDFILVVMLVFIVVVGIFKLIISSNFEISMINSFKLAAIQFLASFMQVLKLLGGLIVMGFIFYKWKAVFFFAGIPMIVVWANMISKQWIEIVGSDNFGENNETRPR